MTRLTATATLAPCRVYSLREFPQTHAMRTCGSRISVVVRTYLDSSGNIDPKQNKLVTLGCYSSKDEHWPLIEDRWNDAVMTAWDGCVVPEGVTPHLHTQALIARTKPFTKENGWTEHKVISFLENCSSIIAECCSRGILKGISATVVLADFQKVQKEIPETPYFQDICAFFCVA